MMKINDITISKLESGKLRKELPDFYELKKIIENNHWHKNESTFAHTITVLKALKRFLNNNKNKKLRSYLNKKIDNYQRKDLLFLATILHDFGKKETIEKEGKISSFPKYEIISVKKAKKVLKNFILSAREKNIILGIIKKHSDLHSIVEVENQKLDNQFQKINKLSDDFIIELIIMVMADTADSYLKETNFQKYKFRMNFYKEKLKIF